MSDGIPKSRVTLTYDTKQPAGREKPRELPFRLLVVGDVGGTKDTPLDKRRIRQLNGRNLGEVTKGLKIQLKDVPVSDDPKRTVNLLVDSVASFSPDEVLRLLTGQKAAHGRVDAMLREAWGPDATPEQLWAGDKELTELWGKRESVLAFQKSYQNSKVLRAALKAFGAPPASEEEKKARQEAIAALRKKLEKPAGAQDSTATEVAGG